MHDFDLIPNEFRERVRIQKWLSIFTLTYLCLLATIVTTKLVLNHYQLQQKTTLESLQKSKQMWVEGKKKLNALRGERKRLQDLSSAFSNLHKGPSARQIIFGLDRALNEHTWFDQLIFQREREQVPLQETVDTGYFIVVPINESKTPNQAWRIKTQLLIKGDVLDHSNLSRLVRELVKRPEIAEAQVLKTYPRQYGGKNAVGFEVAVTLNSRFGIEP